MTFEEKIRRQARMGGASRIPLKVIVSLMDEGPGETLRKAWTVLGRKPAQRKFVRSLDLTEEEKAAQRGRRFSREIVFSILVPLYNTDAGMLREMIDSVREQTYEKWELCMADGSDEAHAYVGEICQRYAAEDSRIRYRKKKEEGNP